MSLYPDFKISSEINDLFICGNSFIYFGEILHFFLKTLTLTFFHKVFILKFYDKEQV